MTNNEAMDELHRQVIEMNIGIYDQIVSINVTKPTGIRGVGDIGAYLHTLQYNPKGKLGEYQFRFIDSLRTHLSDKLILDRKQVEEMIEKRRNERDMLGQEPANTSLTAYENAKQFVLDLNSLLPNQSEG